MRDGEHPCPWDGCDRSFGTKAGVKIHHAKAHGESIAGVEVECAWCGESKIVSPSHAKDHDRHFCEAEKGTISECRRRWQSKHMNGEDHPNWNGGEVTVECAWCGESKDVTPAIDREYSHHFCDRACKRKWQTEHVGGEDHPSWNGGKVEVECTWCGETLRRYPSNISKRNFCDRWCDGEWRSDNMAGEDAPGWKGGTVEVECAVCGTPKMVAPYETAYYDRHFCNPEEGETKSKCYRTWQAQLMSGENNPNWVSGVFSYGPGWNVAKKEQVRERDNRECQNCGLSESEHIERFGRKHHVHHIQKARSFDDPKKRNHPDNLVTLCMAKECHYRWEKMSPLRPQLAGDD